MNIPHEVVYIFLTIITTIQGWSLKEIIGMKTGLARLSERIDNVKETVAAANVVPMRKRL